MVAALGLGPLLLLEQRRSLKPSDLATMYLVASILCDIALLAMRSGVAAHVEISRPVRIRFLMQFVLLILEIWSKRSTLSISNNTLSPEELNGVLSRVFFTWINPILLRGYQIILVEQDLPPLSQDIKPKVTREAILQAWSERG
jgi:ATP-binding cassette subfamily C (CFTR/MRP) protein 1